MRFLKKLRSGNFWVSIISAGILIAEVVFDFEIKTEYLNQILLGILGLLTMCGIISDHGEKETVLPNATNDPNNPKQDSQDSFSNIKSICDTISLLLNKVTINSTNDNPKDNKGENMNNENFNQSTNEEVLEEEQNLDTLDANENLTDITTDNINNFNIDKKDLINENTNKDAICDNKNDSSLEDIENNIDCENTTETIVDDNIDNGYIDNKVTADNIDNENVGNKFDDNQCMTESLEDTFENQKMVEPKEEKIDNNFDDDTSTNIEIFDIVNK